MKTLLFGAALVAACSLYAQNSVRYQTYIDTYASLAVQEMHNSGIPASITLAQGLLESGAGGSTLARTANNHFGIKCHSSWTGKTAYRKDDDRNKHGRLIESCFRSYDDAAQSYADHSEFLTKSPRYAGLFLLKPTDYKGWAKGLKKAGYATSKTYSTKLINLIEQYELHKFDQGNFGLAVSNGPIAANETQANTNRPVLVAATSGSAGRPALTGAAAQIPTVPSERILRKGGVHNINDVQYTFPEPGETLSDIARRTRKFSSDLVKYNEEYRHSTAAPAPGKRIYLQPKRKTFRGKDKFHTVRQGQSMQAIADLYGLATAELYNRNRMSSGTQPSTGEVIQLRGRRKKSDRVKLRSRTSRNRAIATATPPPSRKITTQAAQPSMTGPRKSSSSLQAPAASTATASTSSSRTPALSSASTRRTPTQGRAYRPQSSSPTQKAGQASNIPNATYYTVKSGDTLYGISRKTNTSVNQLKSLNKLTSNTIQPGQRLRTL